MLVWMEFSLALQGLAKKAAGPVGELLCTHSDAKTKQTIKIKEDLFSLMAESFGAFSHDYSLKDF